jgi:hypothetical protein
MRQPAMVREDLPMFEFHGWATLRDRATTEDMEDDPSPHTVGRVRALLTAAPSDFGGVADLRQSNGEWHVWLSGLRNHRQDWVADAFAQIAQIAPGSYGLLHVHDDEARGNEDTWTCWTMLRGGVDATAEERLSPHIGRVEDAA